MLKRQKANTPAPGIIRTKEELDAIKKLAKKSERAWKAYLKNERRCGKGGKRMSQTHLVSIAEVVNEYLRRSPEGKWFTEGATKFFKTRLPQTAYNYGNDYYFITSEYGPCGADCLFTIRRLSGNTISTVNAFGGFRTKAEAQYKLKQILAEEVATSDKTV